MENSKPSERGIATPKKNNDTDISSRGIYVSNDRPYDVPVSERANTVKNNDNNYSYSSLNYIVNNNHDTVKHYFSNVVKNKKDRKNYKGPRHSVPNRQHCNYKGPGESLPHNIDNDYKGPGESLPHTINNEYKGPGESLPHDINNEYKGRAESKANPSDSVYSEKRDIVDPYKLKEKTNSFDSGRYSKSKKTDNIPDPYKQKEKTNPFDSGRYSKSKKTDNIPDPYKQKEKTNPFDSGKYSKDKETNNIPDPYKQKEKTNPFKSGRYSKDKETNNIPDPYKQKEKTNPFESERYSKKLGGYDLKNLRNSKSNIRYDDPSDSSGYYYADKQSESVIHESALETGDTSYISNRGSYYIVHPDGVTVEEKRYNGNIKKVQLRETLEANGIYSRERIERYEKFNRFGFLDPYNGLGITKEYLFFTKPDLHIMNLDAATGSSGSLYSAVNNPFFNDILSRYPKIIPHLQSSAGSNEEKSNPFMTLLSNSVRNTMDLPTIQGREIETAANAYGTSIPYRGSGYKSDENYEFSLEFEDTKYGDVYMLTKTYEEYIRLKDKGLVTPPNVGTNGGYVSSNVNGVAAVDNNGIYYTRYHKYRELHDRFSIYKFVLDDDFETILFWAKAIGVYINTVPRDAFSDLREGGGLKFTIEFKAPFIRDMDPMDIYGFNNLVLNHRSDLSTLISSGKNIPIYRDADFNGVIPIPGTGMINGEWANTPYIHVSAKENSTQWLAPSSMQYVYKLKWY